MQNSSNLVTVPFKPSTKGGMRTAEGTDRMRKQPKSVSIAHESQAFTSKHNTPNKNKDKSNDAGQASPTSLLPSILFKGGQATANHPQKNHVKFYLRILLLSFHLEIDHK